jgi:alpha-glucosidase
MNKKSISFFLCIGLFMLAGCAKKHHTTLYSPDKNIQLTFSLHHGTPQYAVSYRGEDFILPSPLGITFKNQAALDSNFVISSVQQDSANATWSPPYGTADTIRNHYHEMTVKLHEQGTSGRNLKLIFRAYNDGVAFRYQIPQQQGGDSLLITGEKTAFRFANNYSSFALLRSGFSGNYEGQYLKHTLDELPADTLVAMPLLIQLNNGWAALVEADLDNYPAISLTKAANHKNELVTALAPLPENSALKATEKAPFKTPWRTIMLGKRAGDLIPSNLVLNLNEPNKISDTSFIKPGQAIWPWWNGRIADHLKRSGEPSTAVMKYYIDFAAKHHIQALLVDAGWYSTEQDAWAIPKKLNPLTMAPSRKSYYDIHKVINYGKKKGVDVYVWVLDATLLNSNPEKVLSTYADWGIKGIKVDSRGGDNQVHVADIHHIARVAAKNHLMMDFHGAFIPTGWKRTYPNLMTREGVAGLEQSKGSPRPKAKHNVTIPYTRMLTGPMDYTPGAFDLDGTKKHPKHVQTTRAQQVAMYVVYYSPLQMLPDYPGIYEKYPKQFQFVLDIPTTWDATKFIAGEPVQYIILARKSGDKWYVGAMTDKGREVSIPLGFLDKGKQYSVRILKDASDADAHPQHVTMNNKTVASSDSIRIQLAKSGGAAVILSPK